MENQQRSLDPNPHQVADYGRLSRKVQILLQSLLSLLAILLAVLAAIPWLAVALLAVLGLCLLAHSLSETGQVRRWGLVSAWLTTALLPLCLVLGPVPFTADVYFFWLAILNAGAVWLATGDARQLRFRSWDRALAITWGLLGVILLLTTGYLQNRSGIFHLGLTISLVLLISIPFVLNVTILVKQVLLVAGLVIVSLPIVEVFYRPSYEEGGLAELRAKYYSYEVARRDPVAFARWWRFYLREWDRMFGDVFEIDLTGQFPFRPRPGSDGTLFESHIHINQLGFRGREIPDEKGDAYRIVVLGESTTFGCTLFENDRPWPELLEGLIQERLKPTRAVQVINAGVPAYNLRHNLQRMPGQILPLRPDLIITYHGVNGMFLLDESLPRTSGPPPPAFRARPSRLLADCEYRAKMMLYRQRGTAKLILQPPDLATPLQSRYADAYRELIQIARTNEVRLALGNFSLAVNASSSLDQAEFYRAASGGVHWTVRANAAHTLMLQQLVELNPEVSYVDTHPGMDGHPEMFIDLGHMTSEGRARMAENVFNGIRSLLEQELARPSP